jgi:hypothetical protein|nr:MAG TPA: hypothetical protein [Caudoviricetes sp.]
MKGREELLCAILGCGFADLKMIDDCRYDLAQIYSNLKEGYKDVSLNTVIDEIFRLGVLELEEMVSILKEDTKIRLKRVSKGSKIERLLNEKMDEIKSLCPKEDVVWHTNFLDSDIGFCKNESLYRKYFPGEISEIEDDIGFEFLGE